jgi:hypothetical protein
MGTIVDLVENACDGMPVTEHAASAAAQSRADELAEHIERLYEDWSVPALSAGELRTNAAGVNRRVAAGVLAELLYAHTAVVYDPLEWALRAPRIHAEEVSEALMTVALLAPLIRAGVIITVPGRRLLEERADEITAAAWEIVDDAAAFWWDLCGQTTDPYGQRPLLVAKPWALHLAVADATGAHVMPVDEWTYRLHEWTLQRTAEQLRLNNQDLLMAPRVFAADLPWLAPTDPRTLIAMREQEDAFEDWRRALRRSTRGLILRPDEERFAAEARQAFEDELGSAVGELRAARPHVIAAGARPTVTFALSAVGLVGTSALAGTAVGGPLLGAGVGLLAGYVTNLILRDPVGPARGAPVAALGALIRERRKDA